MKNKAYELNLKSDALNAFKTDFDSMLKHTLYTMEQKEGEVAQISATFKISLTKDAARQASEGDVARDVVIPKIEHKLKSLIKIQDERSGYVGGEKYELVWDNDLGEYVMCEIKDCNPSLLDYLNDESEEDKPEADGEEKAEFWESDDDELPFADDADPDEEIDCNKKDECVSIANCGVCCKQCNDMLNCLATCELCRNADDAITAEDTPTFSETVETEDIAK